MFLGNWPWGIFIVFKEKGQALSKRCGISSNAFSIKNCLTYLSETLDVYACSWLCTHRLRMHMHA